MDDAKLNEILLKVRKPARYTGGEWNSVKKDWADKQVKVLLAFPDAYEIGMSYLGMKILYGILNSRADCLCERVFSPWPDFEKVIRDEHIALFSLESRKAIGEFDIIGISLAYELSYTNVLNIFDLGGVPVRSCDRKDTDPIIIAGGPSSYNPEPMADFIDAFVIGDGEEAINEIIDTYKSILYRVQSTEYRVRGAGCREKALKEFAKLKGVYVPSLYRTGYNADGTIKDFSPISEDAPRVVTKRIVKDLNSAFYPVDQAVPYIQIVHDRIAIEIMRGCKHACRFCQAGTTYRPCRERGKEKILDLAKASYAATGYDEVSLLSLSSGDHSEIRDVIKDLNEFFAPKSVSVSVPSLRIEDIIKDLPLLVSQVKKSTLTFAPEAGSECLRKVLNKNIDIEKLFKAASESFKSGWNKLKLYFMIGLPTESYDDIKDIARLLYKVSDLKVAIDGRNAYVTASVNPFVPKPHTPFQWLAMETLESLEKKKKILRGNIKSRMIEVDFHSFRMSYLESIFSRGDRRLSAVIYEAWKAGARFDGWTEHLNIDIWLDSFKKSGIDPAFYTNRKRTDLEILPWDFIDVGVSKETLLKEAASIEGTNIEPIAR